MFVSMTSYHVWFYALQDMDLPHMEHFLVPVQCVAYSIWPDMNCQSG
jgi:hypothetical protein